MDPIEPILPDRPTILPVRGAQRAAPVRRDGRGGAGAQGERHRRRREEEAVEVDVEGLDPSAEDVDGVDGSAVDVHGELEPGPHLGAGAHLGAGRQLLPGPHRFELTAGDEPEPPVHRIDLSA